MVLKVLRPGDNVRILWGQNKGKTGVFLYEQQGRAVVQYSPSTYHRTKLQFENIRKVESDEMYHVR